LDAILEAVLLSDPQTDFKSQIFSSFKDDMWRRYIDVTSRFTQSSEDFNCTSRN